MTYYIFPRIESDEDAEKVADQLLALVEQNKEEREMVAKISKKLARHLKKSNKKQSPYDSGTSLNK